SMARTTWSALAGPMAPSMVRRPTAAGLGAAADGGRKANRNKASNAAPSKRGSAAGAEASMCRNVLASQANGRRPRTRPVKGLDREPGRVFLGGRIPTRAKMGRYPMPQRMTAVKHRLFLFDL